MRLCLVVFGMQILVTWYSQLYSTDKNTRKGLLQCETLDISLSMDNGDVMSLLSLCMMKSINENGGVLFIHIWENSTLVPSDFFKNCNIQDL